MPVLNHIDIVKRQDLDMLLAEREGPCISIFMPTERAGEEIQQNPIRLKNLITEAENQLKDTDLSDAERRDLLAPIQSLQKDHLFWQRQSDGLAVFAAPGEFFNYRLPLNFEQAVIIGRRFHVKPVLPLFSRDHRYFILSLSMNEVRLFQATHHSIGEITLDDVPTSLSEALHLDDPEREFQFHTSTDVPGSINTRSGAFHGHAPDEDQKRDILRFFHKVDAGISGLLDGEQAPLILVGVDYLHPLYQQANDYAHLVEQGVTGNPEEFSLADYHARTWDIVKLRLEDEREKAAERYRSLAGQDTKASDKLEDVVPAAHYGRVDTLFVPRSVKIWGEFDPQTREVYVHDHVTTHNQDLLDMAAVQTITQGGTVYVVEPDRMPTASTIAAILRY